MKSDSDYMRYVDLTPMFLVLSGSSTDYMLRFQQ